MYLEHKQNKVDMHSKLEIEITFCSYGFILDALSLQEFTTTNVEKQQFVNILGTPVVASESTFSTSRAATSAFFTFAAFSFPTFALFPLTITASFAFLTSTPLPIMTTASTLALFSPKQEERDKFKYAVYKSS